MITFIKIALVILILNILAVCYMCVMWVWWKTEEKKMKHDDYMRTGIEDLG